MEKRVNLNGEMWCIEFVFMGQSSNQQYKFEERKKAEHMGLEEVGVVGNASEKIGSKKLELFGDCLEITGSCINTWMDGCVCLNIN